MKLTKHDEIRWVDYWRWYRWKAFTMYPRMAAKYMLWENIKARYDKNK